MRTVIAAWLCWITMGGLPGWMTAAWAATGGAGAIRIAAALSLTGPGDFYGVPGLEGARLAVEEANREHGASPVELEVEDDHSKPDDAAALARRLGGGDVLAVVGPSLTVTSLVTGPIYAQAGLVSLVPTAHGDDVPAAATTFQPIFNTGQIGGALAEYLSHILGGTRATVLFRQDGYGKTFAAGFSQAAARLGMDASLHGFTTDAERNAAAAAAAAEPGHPAVALGILSADAVPIIKALRRSGVNGIILGPDSIAGDNFASLFAHEPEERAKPGFFTDQLYAASPIMFDSADDAVLNFARRFRQRFGHDPSWSAVQGHDATLLAIAAARQAVDEAKADGGALAARRAAVGRYLSALNRPAHALEGVSGALWFTPGRGRDQPVRIGRFQKNLFESAPVQLVPAANPEPEELASGAVFAASPGRFVRRQRVVYTGVFVNEISRVDLPLSRFTADFYVWMRYAGQEKGTDPAAIEFPDLVRSSSDGKKEVAHLVLDDGITYRLWHIRGDFKTEYDLHRYPADDQTLRLRFFNAEGDSTHVVYVQDRRSTVAAPSVGAAAASRFDGVADALAFRQLTQWTPAAAQSGRDNLVTHSGLGDPRLAGLNGTRELSGFTVTVELRRRVVATLVKTLLPLILMAMIMYATLHFPPVLIKEKVTVAVTAALTGAVLLSSLNTSLGAVGYVMDVEYVFYIFFALCLLAIVSALVGERLRSLGRTPQARFVEHSGQMVFVVALAGVVGVAAVVLWQR